MKFLFIFEPGYSRRGEGKDTAFQLNVIVQGLGYLWPGHGDDGWKFNIQCISLDIGLTDSIIGDTKIHSAVFPTNGLDFKDIATEIKAS